MAHSVSWTLDKCDSIHHWVSLRAFLMFPSDVVREQEYSSDVLGENDIKISPFCRDAGVLRFKDKTSLSWLRTVSSRNVVGAKSYTGSASNGKHIQGKTKQKPQYIGQLAHVEWSIFLQVSLCYLRLLFNVEELWGCFCNLIKCHYLSFCRSLEAQ